MNLTNEWFNIQNNLVYYHLDYRTIMDENGEIDDEGGVSSRLLFDPNMPYTIVSNAKIEDPNNYDTGPKTILLPSVYERCDFGNSPYRYGRIGTSLYFNADGENVEKPCHSSEMLPTLRLRVIPTISRKHPTIAFVSLIGIWACFR